MCWYAVGLGKQEVCFDSRIEAYEFMETHPGYTDVIPVDLSDL